jgi:hypothetical protein
MLGTLTGCPAQPAAVPTTPVTTPAQKEVDAMKPNKKHQPKPEAKPAAETLGGSEAGLPDPGRNPAISPQAARAIALAQSKAEADHAQLADLLLDQVWLDRLDPPKTAAGIDPRFLQLTRVLEAAARHAPQVLEAAAGDALYLQSDYRRASLIEASAAAADPGHKLIGLWRSQLNPEADELESTIEALVSSRSAAAVRLLQEAFTSKAFDTGRVIGWFRDGVLRHRQDAELLAGLERLLEGNRLGRKRRFALVEALFEYRPADWYLGTGPHPVPPKRADLTDAARDRLRSIADRAVREKLIDSERRTAIEAELAPTAPPGSGSHGRP